MKLRSLKWRQVNAWRLAQQGLAPRFPAGEIVQAASAALGVQAQVLSAAGMALWARVDGLTAADVRSALWEDRTLVKTWAMRGTLYLLPSGELPLYAAARSLRSYNWTNFFVYYGIPEETYKAYMQAAPRVLGSRPMSREQFAKAVSKRLRVPELYQLIASGNWGSPLKPLAWRGDVCFGPSQGQNVAFVNAHKWLGGWKPVEPEEAGREIVRRYLGSYGPGIPETFHLWWGGASGIVLARRLFKSLEGELERVSVEGWEAYALRSALEDIQASEPRGTVNLLPLFDAYTLGLGRHSELEPHLPAAHHPRVFRPQGWISAVVLLDGAIQGTWELKNQGKTTILQAVPISTFTPRLRKGIEAEAAAPGTIPGQGGEGGI